MAQQRALGHLDLRAVLIGHLQLAGSISQRNLMRVQKACMARVIRSCPVFAGMRMDERRHRL